MHPSTKIKKKIQGKKEERTGSDDFFMLISISRDLQSHFGENKHHRKTDSEFPCVSKCK